MLAFYEDQDANSDTDEFRSLHLEAMLISDREAGDRMGEGSHGPRAWETVSRSLSRYNKQDAQLGYGSWVPDTKSNGRSSSSSSSASASSPPSAPDPTTLRRRAISLRLGGPDWSAYWDAWHVAEMEYQPHLISHVYTMNLGGLVTEPWAESLHKRLLYSDSPQVRKMALAKCPGGGSVAFVRAKVECLESLRGRHNMTYVEGGKVTDLELLVRAAVTSCCAASPAAAPILLECCEDVRMTSLGVANVLAGLGAAPSLSGVLAVHTSQQLKNRSQLEPKVVRDDLALGWATVLSKCAPDKVNNPWDVVYTLSSFPPPFSPLSTAAVSEPEPPAWFDPLRSYLSSLPNSFSSFAAQSLANNYVTSGPSPTSGSPSLALSVREASASLTLLSLLTVGCAEALWPPIMKALRGASVRAYGDAGQVDRAVELLAAASEMRGLGGSGNGDLVVTRDGGMMAPPPAVEAALGEAGAQLRRILASEERYR